LECSLVGSNEIISIIPGTVIYRAYGKAETPEQFACNYGLNPAYRQQISQAGLIIAGIGPAGEVRAVELTGHPFFVGTLFLPQVSSTTHEPHPLIIAYLRAAQNERRDIPRRVVGRHLHSLARGSEFRGSQSKSI
jgi:CTP synthase (UTP-ammonia lyase)